MDGIDSRANEHVPARRPLCPSREERIPPSHRAAEPPSQRTWHCRVTQHAVTGALCPDSKMEARDSDRDSDRETHGHTDSFKTCGRICVELSYIEDACDSGHCGDRPLPSTSAPPRLASRSAAQPGVSSNRRVFRPPAPISSTG